MKTRKARTGDLIVEVLIVIAAVILGISLSMSNVRRDTDRAARKVEKAVSERMAILKDFSDKALSAGRNEWIGSMGLPDDMVIYRYLDDSLKSWCNRFPLKNDNINVRAIYQRLSRPHENVFSPLTEVTGKVSFVNYGQKWYLVRSEILNNGRVISGLEIIDLTQDDSPGGVNRQLGLGAAFSIVPLSESGGSPVTLDGVPIFKVIDNGATGASLMAHSVLIWISIALLVIAIFVHLTNKRCLKRLLAVIPALYVTMSATVLWGQTIKDSSTMFSPLVYADGKIFNSIGDAFIFSMAIAMTILCFFLVREDIYRKLASRRKPAAFSLYAATVSLALAGLFTYIHLLIRSIIFNSNIILELYKFNELNSVSLLVYTTLALLLMAGALLFQMLMPALRKITGKRFNAYSTVCRVIYASMLSSWILLEVASLGFEKEKDRVAVWANRLSIERDIRLELDLRMQEDKIASDQYLATFAAMKNSTFFVRNRIVDNYLGRISQDYDVGVEIFTEDMKTPQTVAYFTSMVSSGIAINEGSRFRYISDDKGNHLYVGSFAFYSPDNGLAMMLLSVSPKSNREEKGYGAILGYSPPGEVLMPSRYSYAKYSSLSLTSSKGNYAYPTLLDDMLQEELLAAPDGLARVNGYTHFINMVSGEMMIIISRPKTENYSYFVSFLLCALVIYLLLSILTLARKGRKDKEKNYYKSRINAAMMIALIMTLIALASVSVTFVYKRNNANMMSSMASKVNYLQTMLQARFRFAQDQSFLNSAEFSEVLEDASSTMKADITLYSIGGREVKSTTPEVFDRMFLPARMDPAAYENIVYKNRKYFINSERIGSQKVYFLYAPLFSATGEMMAIMASPYTDESFDFKSEALLHSITVVVVFMILLLLARFITASAVDKMFKPLTEMGRKMNEADIQHLEYIVYERDDEVSRLVRAYNRMVHDLSNSTKQLAMSERDKAWATMARQVAHEIKNPLTPIKLQIQRLIRLKNNGNPVWIDRFDEISGDVLKQIDILADTANEFSTFAKLYTEEHVEIDLDKLISEEISLFDSREDIEFSYMGLSGAKVVGPKPQLTRVLTNLLGNAVQAIENAQAETVENGNEPFKGKVMVSLRFSTRDGFYDIVIEDNGPGVSEENRSKLFTPNFTTKSNGTGLGLSICRSILEKCNGEIAYSRSFTLKGACFTVRFPRP